MGIFPLSCVLLVSVKRWSRSVVLLRWTEMCLSRGLRRSCRSHPSRSWIPPYAETIGRIFSSALSAFLSLFSAFYTFFRAHIWSIYSLWAITYLNLQIRKKHSLRLRMCTFVSNKISSQSLHARLKQLPLYTVMVNKGLFSFGSTRPENLTTLARSNSKTIILPETDTVTSKLEDGTGKSLSKKMNPEREKSMSFANFT